MQYIYLLSIFLIYFPLNITNKLCSNGITNKVMLFKISLVKAVFGTVAGIIIFFIKGESFWVDTAMLLSAVMFGMMLAACTIFTLYSMQITSIAITSMYAAASVIIPIGFDKLFFGENITTGKIIGLCLFLVSAYFIVGNSSDSKRKFTLKTFIVCIMILITNGLGAVAIQSFAKYSNTGNDSLFMALSYAVNAILLLIAYLIVLSKNNKKVSNAQTPGKNLFILGGASAVFQFVTQQIQTNAAVVVPATILFPFSTASGVITGAVVGWIMFKEKLSVKNIIGILTGIISLIMLNSL